MSAPLDQPTGPWRARLSPARLAIAVAGVVLPSLLLQSALFDRSVVPMDEGHLAAAAQWMLHGQALYRDIHTGIFPGIYYLAAALFRVTTPDLLVLRLAAVAVNTGTALCLFLIARRIVRLHWAALAPLLHLTLVAIAFPVLTMFNYSTLSLAFGLAALLFTLRYLEDGRRTDGIALGLWITACALTKQNFGGLVLIACFAGLAWERPRSALRERTFVASFAPVVGAGAACALLALVHFAWIGTLPHLVESTILALGGSQVVDFNNPIPPLFGAMPLDDSRFVFLYLPPTLFNLLVHGEPFLGSPIGPGVIDAAIRGSYGLPLATLAAGAIWLGWNLRGPASDAPRSDRVVCLFALVFFPGMFPSAIWSHLCFVLPPITLVFVLLLDRLEGALASGAGLGLRVAGGALAIVCVFAWLGVAGDVRRWYPHPMGVERASLKGSTRQVDLLRGSTDFVERCTADEVGSGDGPGWLFVAPDIPLLYFLADRLNPSPYDLMIPGNVDGALIAARLDETATRCAVYNPAMYPEFPPFETLFPQLSRYLSSHYRTAARMRGGDTEWVGLVRREAPTP